MNFVDPEVCVEALCATSGDPILIESSQKKRGGAFPQYQKECYNNANYTKDGAPQLGANDPITVAAARIMGLPSDELVVISTGGTAIRTYLGDTGNNEEDDNRLKYKIYIVFYRNPVDPDKEHENQGGQKGDQKGLIYFGSLGVCQCAEQLQCSYCGTPSSYVGSKWDYKVGGQYGQCDGGGAHGEYKWEKSDISDENKYQFFTSDSTDILPHSDILRAIQRDLLSSYGYPSIELNLHPVCQTFGYERVLTNLKMSRAHGKRYEEAMGVLRPFIEKEDQEWNKKKDYRVKCEEESKVREVEFRRLEQERKDNDPNHQHSIIQKALDVRNMEENNAKLKKNKMIEDADVEYARTVALAKAHRDAVCKDANEKYRKSCTESVNSYNKEAIPANQR
jgi:hypothetical protein